MKPDLTGKIESYVPFFFGLLETDGSLTINSDEGFPMVIDTGFSGGIALPEDILETLETELIDFGVFKLATGEEVELPVFWGKVNINSESIETWFISGDFLIGMEFLSSVGSQLLLDFIKKEVKLLLI